MVEILTFKGLFQTNHGNEFVFVPAVKSHPKVSTAATWPHPSCSGGGSEMVAAEKGAKSEWFTAMNEWGQVTR